MPTASSDTAVRPPVRCSPYDPGKLARYRSLLIHQQTEILQCCQGLSNVALRRSGGDAGDNAAVSDDSADQASENSEQDLSLNFLGRAQAELEEIARALAKIDGWSYGVCDECGKTIPDARLEALPTASFCLECKAKSEAL